MNPERQKDYEESFEILGKKAATVDKATMGNILRSMGLNPTNDEVSELFSSNSSDGSTIDAGGVVKAAAGFETKMKGEDQLAVLKEAFSVFDKEGGGKISAAELRHILSNLGEKVDEDEVEEMMAEADADGSGYIDYKEFVAVLLKPLAVPPRKEIPEELKPYMPKPKEEKKSDKGE